MIDAARQLNAAVLGIVAVDFLHSPDAPSAPRPPAGADFGAAMRQGMFSSGSDPVLRERIIGAMTSVKPSLIGGLQRAIMEYDIDAALRALAGTPLSLLLSELRPIDPEAIRTRHRAARVVAMRNVGHFMMLEAPEDFNALLRTETMLLTEKIRLL